MVRRQPLEVLFIALAMLTSPARCASRQSFCKCVCGYNSTIIPLDGKPLENPAPKHRLSSLSTSNLHSATASSFSSSSTGSTSRSADLDDASPAYAVDDRALHIRARHAEAHSNNEARDESEDGDVNDPLAHAQTAELHQFEDNTALASSASATTRSHTVTSTSASSSASVTGEKADESTPGNSTDTQLVSPQRAGTCNDCNRQFCLEHPDFDKMCGEAKEEEVFTTCFQRDSAKDQLVVYTFIFVTVGLLGYAAVRPWIEKKYEAVRERRSYTPVSQVPNSG